MTFTSTLAEVWTDFRIAKRKRADGPPCSQLAQCLQPSVVCIYRRNSGSVVFVQLWQLHLYMWREHLSAGTSLCRSLSHALSWIGPVMLLSTSLCRQPYSRTRLGEERPRHIYPIPQCRLRLLCSWNTAWLCAGMAQRSLGKLRPDCCWSYETQFFFFLEWTQICVWMK